MANAGIKAPQDFNNIPFEDWKQTIIRMPVSKTTDFYGDESFTDASTASIEAIFIPVPKNSDFWNKYGLVGGADGVVYVKTSQELSKNDKIIVNSRTYRLDKVTTRYAAGTAMYKVAPFFLIDEDAQTPDPSTFPLVLG